MQFSKAIISTILALASVALAAPAPTPAVNLEARVAALEERQG